MTKAAALAVPPDVADKVQRMRRAGHSVTVEPAVDMPMLRLMDCRSCDTNIKHWADVIVNVVYASIWTDPIERLEGQATPCCWLGLADCLDEVEHTERFESVVIEVPVIAPEPPGDTP